ncbi:MAG TPA: hypothetical protein VG347_03600 [Verrucomicrobiae bacterium]|nr:hypothetical protein [Verrucomicrobiae bacterium]
MFLIQDPLPGRSLEHFQKSYRRSVMTGVMAVFLGFGFVSAQSQGCSNLLLRQSLAKTQKSSLRTAITFLQTLQGVASIGTCTVNAQLIFCHIRRRWRRHVADIKIQGGKEQPSVERNMEGWTAGVQPAGVGLEDEYD